MPHHAIDIGRADELAALVVNRFEMISMADAEEILGLGRWQLLTAFADGDVIVLRHQGRMQLPRCQFDEKRGRVLPALRPILKALPDHWSLIRLLHWLSQPHSDLSGDRPMEHLAADGARVAVVSLFLHDVDQPAYG